MRHAEIAGAGFAGLTAAIALRQRGWSVRVHEADAELRAFGAGIFIWENGLRVLKAIGAYDDVVAGAYAAPGYHTSRDGERLAYERINGANRFRLLTMTRQHLYAAILAAARRMDIEIITSSAATGAAPEGVLHLADGRSMPADLVIGADGVRSAVRDSLGLIDARNKYQDGIIRVLVGRATLKGGVWDDVIDFWSFSPRPLRILYTPCGEDDLYMAMMAPTADREASSIPVNAEVWIRSFPQLAPALSAIGDRGRYDLYETTTLKRWSAGRTALIGDAAHAMPPTLAQGAGCAMMNALSLAVAVSDADDIDAALRRWEARERPLTDHTQSRAAHLAGSRALADGMPWEDDCFRAARHIPTGTPPQMHL
ncbi:FAD-dependent oxidoreductase [Vineibacter terrae]|uniref:FAD-dependent oxidoreductase n=1 Tax=Vineibacter terrae TaxID=2586908 RepID=UPI0015B6B1CC|nr:NAD(P)/FAD-dependent oxidoreductase [Vineibacter terrae]